MGNEESEGMSLEDEFVRDTRAMERIADALDQAAIALTALAMVQKERLEKDFPAPKVKRDAEIIRADERAEQYNDKPSNQWLEETQDAAGLSRFAKRFEESGVQAPPQKRGRTVEVPQGDGNKTKPS